MIITHKTEKLGGIEKFITSTREESTMSVRISLLSGALKMYMEFRTHLPDQFS